MGSKRLLSFYSIECEEYPNFRPISNFRFVSKITEKAVACQLMNHLTDNYLDEPLQSAYKRFNSTETALLKVQNDTLTQSIIRSA